MHKITFILRKKNILHVDYSLRLYFLICIVLLFIIAVYNNGLKMKKYDVIENFFF